jgi:hypothetical protein
MASESIDYERVIADLESKRAAFNAAVDGAILGLRHVVAAIAGLPTVQIQGAHIPSTAVVGGGITPDMFFGLGIAEAAIKYLSVVKKQQSSREITDALEAAGYHHTSQNFLNTVNTALYRRVKDEGDVVKIGRNWALAEWYPGRRRAASLRPSDFETDSSQAPSGEPDED